MGPQDRSFSQVKAILGKLDRSIDKVREERTGAVLPAPVPLVPMPRAVDVPVAPPRAASPFGRATPLPPR